MKAAERKKAKALKNAVGADNVVTKNTPEEVTAAIARSQKRKRVQGDEVEENEDDAMDVDEGRDVEEDRGPHSEDVLAGSSTGSSRYLR